MRRRVAVVVSSVALVAVACGPTVVEPADGVDASGEESTASPSSSGVGPTSTPGSAGDVDATTTPQTSGSSTTTKATGSSSGSSTTGPGLLCPGNPLSDCTSPPNCELWHCGDVNSPLDEDGCPRPDCELDGSIECPDGMRCHSTHFCGVCSDINFSCGQDPKYGCQCGGDGGCGETFCVPDSFPKGYCGD